MHIMFVNVCKGGCATKKHPSAAEFSDETKDRYWARECIFYCFWHLQWTKAFQFVWSFIIIIIDLIHILTFVVYFLSLCIGFVFVFQCVGALLLVVRTKNLAICRLWWWLRETHRSTFWHIYYFDYNLCMLLFCGLSLFSLLFFFYSVLLYCLLCCIVSYQFYIW